MDTPQTPTDNATPWTTWRDAAARPEIDVALRTLYAELDDAITQRGPTCWSSGKCCKFDDFGHRLYVTGLEIAWFLGQCGTRDAERGTDDPPVGIRLPQLAEHPGACPYQIDGLCSTHTVRPLGCRIFFCQRGTEAWQQDLYETYLDRLRRFHEAQQLEYRYMDWIAGLDEATRALA